MILTIDDYPFYCKVSNLVFQLRFLFFYFYNVSGHDLQGLAAIHGIRLDTIVNLLFPDVYYSYNIEL